MIERQLDAQFHESLKRFEKAGCIYQGGKMKVEVLKYPVENDWTEVLRRCLVTVGKKSDKIPDIEWRKKLLRCRHSPIRYLQFSFCLKDIPYWLHVELVRHHVGVQFYVRSQRDDRAVNEVPRSQKPQGALVDLIMDVNAEALLTISNKRLCGCATREMQTLMILIRNEVIKTNPEFEDYLVPMCQHMNYGCPEYISCKGKAFYFSEVKHGKEESNNEN